MKTYFDIRFEFDHDTIHDSIERQLALGTPDYICVADDEVLMQSRKDSKYRSAVNNGMFTICDSSYVTKSIKLVHNEEYEQYYGSHFFLDILSERKHRMMLLGGSEMELRGLKREMIRYNPDVKSMNFVELPFGEVDDFDYRAIARMINTDGADIIWIALDSPDQEIFMAKLKPFLKRGVMIGIGAAIKYFSAATARYGQVAATSPTRQIAHHFSMIKSLPGMLVKEWFKTSVRGKSTEVKERYAFESI